MYHRIVAGKLRATFEAINSGDWEKMVQGMAPNFTYVFYGNHALSGTRHTPDALRAWWQRIDRLLPGTTFQVDEVIVAGPPWNTRAATSITVHAGLPDGTKYDNVINQFLRIAWGKVTEVKTLEDTALLSSVPDRLAVSGVDEAHAAPLTDEPVAAGAG